MKTIIRNSVPFGSDVIVTEILRDETGAIVVETYALRRGNPNARRNLSRAIVDAPDFALDARAFRTNDDPTTDGSFALYMDANDDDPEVRDALLRLKCDESYTFGGGSAAEMKITRVV